MNDLLVTKGSKIYCSIVNNFFGWFIVYCYTIVLSNAQACDRDCLVYQFFFFYISLKNDYILILLMLFVI
jgi:hypothetical protein